MGEIYKMARRVIVWLGEESEGDNDSHAAFAFLHQLVDLRSALESDNNEAIRAQLQNESFNAQWRAVGNLFGRPWWKRVWTLQEFILPPEVKFYCGTASISRSRFRRAMYCIHSITGGLHIIPLPLYAFNAAWNRRRVLQWYEEEGKLGLISSLAYLGNHEAGDPRDRIYSVLGLVSERDKRLVGAPNYSLSVEQTYAKLVKKFWEEYNRLDIICFTHIFNPTSPASSSLPPLSNSDQSHTTLPSWAPDWRTHVQCSPVPLMASQSANPHIGNFRPLHSKTWKAAYNADGTELRKQAKVKFYNNLKEMCADGVILDEIDGLGGLEGCVTRCTSRECQELGHKFTQIQQHQSQSPKAKQRSDLEILEAVVKSLALDRKNKYLQFRAPKHYTSDFLMLYHSYVEGKAVDEIIPSWFKENKELLIGERTLGQILDDIIASEAFSSLPPPIPQGSLPPDGTEPCFTRFCDTVHKKGRRLMVTNEGLIGVAACRARQGDVIAILFGSSIPIILRRIGSREAWKVIGEAYVHGYMNGEVEKLVTAGKRNVKTFRLA
jgi:hypothetical protein